MTYSYVHNSLTSFMYRQTGDSQDIVTLNEMTNEILLKIKQFSIK